MEKVMTKEREYLNHIYNIIMDGNYEIARKRINELKEKSNYTNYAFEIDFLENYLIETEYFNVIKGTPEGKMIEKYLYDGKQSLYYENYEEAAEYFDAGAYLTNYPLFYYLSGKALIGNDERREEAVEKLEKYLSKFGASKAYKAYDALGKYYKYIDEKKARKYRRRSEKLSLIMSLNHERKDQDIVKSEIEEVMNLSKEHNYDGLIEKFNDSTDSIKIRIIGELYKTGYINQANKIYKKNRKKFDSNKSNRKLVYQLDQNKKLFINKGKHFSGS